MSHTYFRLKPGSGGALVPNWSGWGRRAAARPAAFHTHRDVELVKGVPQPTLQRVDAGPKVLSQTARGPEPFGEHRLHADGADEAELGEACGRTAERCLVNMRHGAVSRACVKRGWGEGLGWVGGWVGPPPPSGADFLEALKARKKIWPSLFMGGDPHPTPPPSGAELLKGALAVRKTLIVAQCCPSFTRDPGNAGTLGFCEALQ